MSDLICRKSMMRCQTPGMCSPHGGCGASTLVHTNVRYDSKTSPAVVDTERGSAMTNEDLKALALAAIDQEQRWKEAGEPWPIWNTRLLEMQAAANPAAVLGLIEDNERLETYKAAYMEWSDKTDWVQETAEVRELGKHRADVIRERFDALKAALEHEQARVTDYIAQRAQSDRNCDALKAECEGLRKALSECATSLEGEMLQKFHGQKPDDMHPVTRREYGRDMEELAGYRTALGQGGQSNG